MTEPETSRPRQSAGEQPGKQGLLMSDPVDQSGMTAIAGRPRRGTGRPPLVLAVLAAVGAFTVLAPLVGLIVRAPWGSVLGSLAAPASREALWLSLVCSLSAMSLCVLLGVPLAWMLQRTRLPGRRVLQAAITLPVVLPPVVSGVALLLAFGRRGLIGDFLDETFGIRLAFTTPGVVLAETFVALPFLVLAISGALESADQRLEEAARTLGASRWRVFRTVTLPLIRPSLLAGAVLAWARALGEFGATITFAGNFPGVTQTLPLAVYTTLETDPDGAITLSLALVAVSLAVLISLRHRWISAL